MTNTDIATAGTELMANPTGPLTPDQAREAQRLYQEISQALIDPAEDLQTIRTKAGPRTFPKRSALQKLANAYRVSTEILQRHTTHNDDGQLIRCDAIVRATHPDGRHADGDGACAASEERFARGGAEKIDHDLPATAVTRATNRAISNLIAFGAVSAEEAEAGEGGAPTSQEPAPVPPWARHDDDVGTVAGNLVDILKAAGGTDAADKTGDIGQQIFDQCDGGIPRCVSFTVRLLHDQITKPAEPTPPAGGFAPGSGLEENQA